MPNLNYILPRVVRHFLPESLVGYLLKHSLIIQPGLETLSPEKAVERYIEKLKFHKLSLAGKRVLIFGYGGNLTIGCLMLDAGARQIILCERQDFSYKFDYKDLGNRYHQYLTKNEDRYTLNPQYLVLFHGDIAKLAENKSLEKMDLVLSTSVFEHLTESEKVTNSLAQLTSPTGSHLHFIDLRDHFFKYPFEMLCYSNSTWERWLNPTSNLNRLRIFDYHNLFSRHFSKIEIITEERDMDNFLKSRPRIQKKFLSGDDEEDSITQIHLVVSMPKITNQ